jgi:hypothetical protein
MRRSVLAIATFRPQTLEDVFALYLARELSDATRVRWYARLSERFSMCLLLNGLRRARAASGRERVSPEQFIHALEQLTEGPVV